MATYRFPSDLTPAQLRAEAARRRRALITGGCTTYTIGSWGGVTAIVCLCCGLGSANATDVREKYCRFCQAGHSEWQDAADAGEEA